MTRPADHPSLFGVTGGTLPFRTMMTNHLTPSVMVMEGIDENLRRTSAAVNRYRVPERIIALAAGSLTSMTEQQRHDHGMDAIQDALLLVAEQHAGPHPDCVTCNAVSNGLAVTLGVVRAEVDVEMERKIAH